MIVCCGEALIDMLPRRSVEGEDAFAPYSGGAVFNSAIALGRLGAPVEFFTGLSTDLFGDRLRETLNQSRVGVRYAHRSDRPTTLAFVKLTNGQASYVFYDENTAGRMLSAADLPHLADDVDAMLFGGISLIAEPAAATYAALMAAEAPRRVTMLDPNVRPGFIRDRAAYEARIRAMIAVADIVKISDEDLRWFGETGAVDDIIARWLDLGPKLVILTRGADGASGYTKRFRTDVGAQKVEVVDTVGAGDTFNAGVLSALHEAKLLTKPAIASLDQAAVRAALELGGRAAAVTVSRAGANPPWRSELA